MNIRAQIFGTSRASEAGILCTKQPRGVKADTLHSIPVRREASRRGDTRFGDRYRMIGENARLTHNGCSHDVQLINVCGGGAMVAADLEALPWDKAELHVGDNGTIRCAVLWIKNGRVGLTFAEETRLDCSEGEQAALLREVIARHFPDAQFDAPRETESAVDEHRAEQRHPLIWSGTLHHDYQSTPARLRNISTTGAMVETEAVLARGAEPLLDLGEAGSIFADVVWVAGDHAGLRFREPFDMAQLAKSRPEVASAGWQAPAYLRSDLLVSSRWERHWQNMTAQELGDDIEGFAKR